MPLDVSRNNLRVPRKRGKVVLKEVVYDWDDSCHVQHNVHIGLEPELLAVVVNCVWVCGGVVFVHGPLQTVQALTLLPDSQLLSVIQASVSPVKSDSGCLQRQQVRACVVDMDKLHLQSMSTIIDMLSQCSMHIVGLRLALNMSTRNMQHVQMHMRSLTLQHHHKMKEEKAKQVQNTQIQFQKIYTATMSTLPQPKCSTCIHA